MVQKMTVGNGAKQPDLTTLPMWFRPTGGIAVPATPVFWDNDVLARWDDGTLVFWG